jgi:hypothetical protein
MSCVIAILVTLPVARPALGQCPAVPAVNGQAVARFSCTLDPMLTRLFTPRSVSDNLYRVYVADAPVDQVARAFDLANPPSEAAGAWVLEPMDPLDAYGTAGPYDRAKVARLYVGVRPRVAHGPIVEQGRTVASITLISPYPNASLSELHSGTLIIEFRIPRHDAR